MTLLIGGRRQQQVRSWTADPPIPPNSQAGWGGSPAPLNLSRTEASLQKVAVFASVNLIAGVCSMLPVDGYVGRGAGKREVPLPAFFTDADGSGQGFEDWLYQCLWSLLLRGNVVGRVVGRDAKEKATQIVLFHPDHVSLQETTDGPVWRYRGERIPTEEVWHRRAFPVPGCRLGLSPIALHMMTIGQGLSAARFGLKFFTADAHPSAVLTQKDVKEVDQTTAATVKARFLAAVRGTREPVVLSGGWEYIPIQINPEESQFLETQKYTAAECARIFGPGMPETLGYETGGPLTYNTPELRGIELLKFSLNRWLRWAERVLSTDVMPKDEWVKLNRGALVETDLLTRFQAHGIALDKGFESVEEVRELEDLTLDVVQAVKVAKSSDALGVLVRAGFEPSAAAIALGLDPIAHTGLVPITVTLPEGK